MAKKRFLALLLTIIMLLGILPTAAFAAGNTASINGGDLVAVFDAAELQLDPSATSYTSTLKLKFDSSENITGVVAEVNWADLGSMTNSVKVSSGIDNSITSTNTSGTTGNTITPQVGHYTSAISVYTTDPFTAEDGDMLKLKFTFNNELAAGTYSVPIVVTMLQLADGGNAVNYITSPVSLTAVLKVKNADGSDPAVASTYAISKDVQPVASYGTISGPDSAVAGDHVSLTMVPATGYELVSVDVLGEGGGTITASVTNENVYSFVMPDEAVNVTATFRETYVAPTITAYDLRVNNPANGSVSLNGVTSAKAADTVSVYVKANAGYHLDEIAVTANGVALSVTDTGNTQVIGGVTYDVYTFQMVAAEANINVQFAQDNVTPPSVPVNTGKLRIMGTVLSGENHLLPGATVTLHVTDNNTIPDVTVVTGNDGAYDFGEVDNSYTYTVQASYKTNIKAGQNNTVDGDIRVSDEKTVSRSSTNTTGVGEVLVSPLTVALYYNWDVDNDGEVEKIYAGADDAFLGTDDYYEKIVGGQTVRVYSDVTGEKNMQDESAHYFWLVDLNSTVKAPVYLGTAQKAGEPTNFYYVDVDPNNKNPQLMNAQMMVFIAEDKTPATADDFYMCDVQNDGVRETVKAGTANMIPAAANYYIENEVTVFAGEDMTAGTADDWYAADATGDGMNEVIFVGADRLMMTNSAAVNGDDYYMLDADNDGREERIYAGIDKQFNDEDDFYWAEIPYDEARAEREFVGQESVSVVKVYPGERAESDRYEFGMENDHYSYSVAGVALTVRVGVDLKAGTSDDEYDWAVKQTESGLAADAVDSVVIVYAGEDGIAGTPDDFYNFNADAKDTALEQVFIGEDATPGASDDHYFKNVNTADGNEKVFAGSDAVFHTNDDFYFDSVAGVDIQVFAGSSQSDGNGGEKGDALIGTRDDIYPWTLTDGNDNDVADIEVRVGDDLNPGTNDDEYDYNIPSHDADGNPSGTDAVIVHVTGDHPGITGKGTDGDYYLYDTHGDTDPEQCFVGVDGLPGTADDFYVKDVNGDGENETVYAGEDGAFRTTDDHYPAVIEKIGSETDKDVEVIAGIGGGIGDANDFYMADADNDSNDEQIFVGSDRIPGTEDDCYIKDVNHDGQDEVVFAGTDRTFPTNEDYYYGNEPYDSTNAVQVFAGDKDSNGDGKIGTEDDYFVKDADQDGVPDKVYVGDDKKAGTEDDWYYHDIDGENPVEKVYSGPDGISGTEDDIYPYDALHDGNPIDVHVGPDAIPGTEDDYYMTDADHDPNNGDETVYVGPDGIPGTNDDHYQKNLPIDADDGTGNPTMVPTDIYAGDQAIDPETSREIGDKTIGTEDDYYERDLPSVPVKDNDGDGEPDTENTKVYVGPDQQPGTEDDWYNRDVDGDGKDETIYIGPDSIPGTEDDVYPYDYNNDGNTEGFDDDNKPQGSDPIDNDGREIVHVGEDGIPGTEDDHYLTDADNDPDNGDETVYIGPDTNPGTNDDFYHEDVNDDGNTETVIAGTDDTIGTDVDHYEFDIDNDGKNETVYVGPDSRPGTQDDWYYADITFDANGGKLNSSIVTMLTSEIQTLPTATRSGYTFLGWSRSAGSSAVLNLDEVKAIKVDTTLYAAWRANSYSSGGGGGGGGGSSAPTYKVTFMTDKDNKVSTANVYSGSKLSEPAAPTKDGYVFTGWYTDEACTKKYDFSTPVTKAMTLYAGWRERTVDDNVFGLLTSDHVAYIFGYEDNEVRGENNMTRAEAAMMFYRLLNEEAREANMTSQHSFADIPASAWYETAVATLTKLGILQGYGDGQFGPNDLITREQFALICARIGKLVSTGKVSFTDVSASDWSAEGITAAAEAGWITGYPDGTFGSKKNITRAEAVTLLNRVLKRDTLTAESFKDMKDLRTWPDLDEGNWAYLAMIEAGNGHEFKTENGHEMWTAIENSAK